jgi:hypothetical protein
MGLNTETGPVQATDMASAVVDAAGSTTPPVGRARGCRVTRLGVGVFQLEVNNAGMGVGIQPNPGGPEIVVQDMLCEATAIGMASFRTAVVPQLPNPNRSVYNVLLFGVAGAPVDVPFSVIIARLLQSPSTGPIPPPP